MSKQRLTIATRESPLALKQAEWVKKRLEAVHPTLQVHLLGMTTQADQMLTLSLAPIGGKGLFVKELEEALLDGRADIAVHSMKDVPMSFPEGLCLPVICEREQPSDVFLSHRFATIDALPPKAIVATSSLRRQSQLLALRPDLTVVPLRGNVNTRLKRLDKGDFDALILAEAGLKRLGLQEPFHVRLPITQMLPAAGQGALGIECRSDDKAIAELIHPLNHHETAICVTAERSLCKQLGGNCQVPVGAYAEIVQHQLLLRGLVASTDGKKILRAEQMGELQQATALGVSVAEMLLQQGAKEILNACDGHSSKTTG